MLDWTTNQHVTATSWEFVALSLITMALMGVVGWRAGRFTDTWYLAWGTFYLMFGNMGRIGFWAVASALWDVTATVCGCVLYPDWTYEWRGHLWVFGVIAAIGATMIVKGMMNRYWWVSVPIVSAASYVIAGQFG